jgi:hypothetical protein
MIFFAFRKSLVCQIDNGIGWVNSRVCHFDKWMTGDAVGGVYL